MQDKVRTAYMYDDGAMCVSMMEQKVFLILYASIAYYFSMKMVSQPR